MKKIIKTKRNAFIYAVILYAELRMIQNADLIVVINDIIGIDNLGAAVISHHLLKHFLLKHFLMKYKYK